MMTLIDKIKLLFIVSRPLSWIIAPAIWVSGLAQSGTNIQAIPAILYVVALSFPTCLGMIFVYNWLLILILGWITHRAVTFGVNDVYDHDSDAQNIRKKSHWADGTVLKHGNHRFILLSARISTILVILLALPASLQSLEVLGCTLSFLSMTWIYSSPPLRLKERPIWDSVSNGIICWIFWICGYTFSDERVISIEVLASKNGWFVLLYASALHSLAALLDAPADSSAQYRTIATVLGERFTAAFSMVSL